MGVLIHVALSALFNGQMIELFNSEVGNRMFYRVALTPFTLGRHGFLFEADPI